MKSNNASDRNGQAAVHTRARRSRRRTLVGAVRAGWTTIVFDVIGPIAAYHVAIHLGAGKVAALVWSALPPAVALVVEFARARRINGVGAIVLVSLVLAVLLAFLGGSAEELVARDAYVNSILGLTLAVSVPPRRRPLLYHLLLAAGADFVPGLRKSFAEQWTGNRYFRRYLRTTSVTLGAILLGESVARVALARVLPLDVTVATFQVEGFLLWTALLVPLTVGYRRAVTRMHGPHLEESNGHQG